MTALIAPPDPRVFLQSMRIPSGARPRDFARTMNVHNAGAPMTTHVQGDWPDNTLVQKGFVQRQFGDKYSTTAIRQGQLIFLRRTAPLTTAAMSGDTEEFTLVNIGQLNMILREHYDEAYHALSGLMERGRGLPETRVIEFLRSEECVQAQIFQEYCDDAIGPDQGRTALDLTNQRQCIFHMKQMFQGGIHQLWSCLGTSIISSAPGTQSQGYYSYTPLNIAFDGSQLIQNIWGAGSGCECGIIWKRRRERNGTYGAFGVHPYSRAGQDVSQEATEYLDHSGTRQFGRYDAIALADEPTRFVDIEHKLGLVTGLAEEATPTLEYKATSEMPVLRATLNPALYQRYLTTLT
jgi:hypothetical protein